MCLWESGRGNVLLCARRGGGAPPSRSFSKTMGLAAEKSTGPVVKPFLRAGGGRRRRVAGEGRGGTRARERARSDYEQVRRSALPRPRRSMPRRKGLESMEADASMLPKFETKQPRCMLAERMLPMLPKLETTMQPITSERCHFGAVALTWRRGRRRRGSARPCRAAAAPPPAPPPS